MPTLRHWIMYYGNKIHESPVRRRQSLPGASDLVLNVSEGQFPTGDDALLIEATHYPFALESKDRDERTDCELSLR